MAPRALLILTAFVSSCSRGAATPAAPAATNAMLAAAPAEQVVSAYMAAYNRHDVPAMLQMVDSAMVWLSIVGDSIRIESRGADALQQSLEQYFRAVPTARSTTEALTSLGPWVTVHERAHWQGASGPRSQASVSVYEVRDGRIRRVWYYPSVKQ